MVVSVIIVNFNGGIHTRECLASLFACTPIHQGDVVVVDNASTDGSKQLVAEGFPAVRVIPLDRNAGFGAANNAGARESHEKYLFFVNNDTLFTEDAISPLCGILEERPELGIVAPALKNADGTFQLSFGPFPSIGGERLTRRWMRGLRAGDPVMFGYFSREYGVQREVDWVSGAAFLIRKSVFDAIGGFDEGFFLYFEDSDLCRRVADARYGILYEPSRSIVHLGGKSYAPGDGAIEKEYRKSQLRYYDKHLSWPQRLSLRFYLALKYGAGSMARKKGDRSRSVIRQIFRNQAT